jgi:hypothetical protein
VYVERVDSKICLVRWEIMNGTELTYDNISSEYGNLLGMFSAANGRILKNWGYALGHFSVPLISMCDMLGMFVKSQV